MVGHDDVADDVEFVTGSELFEEVEDGVSSVWSSEDGAVTEAGEGDDVEVSGDVVTDQAGGHFTWIGLGVGGGYGALVGFVGGLREGGRLLPPTIPTLSR